MRLFVCPQGSLCVQMAYKNLHSGAFVAFGTCRLMEREFLVLYGELSGPLIHQVLSAKLANTPIISYGSYTHYAMIFQKLMVYMVILTRQYFLKKCKYEYIVFFCFLSGQICCLYYLYTIRGVSTECYTYL